MSIYGKADLSQYYHMAPLNYIQDTFVDFLDNNSSQLQDESFDADSKATDLMLLFKLLKIIDSHLALSATTTAADSTRSAKLQNIQSLTDELTITNQNFLVQFCSYFNKINNTDEIVSEISLLLDLFDVEKTIKRLDYLRNEDDDEEEMGKLLFF